MSRRGYGKLSEEEDPPPPEKQAPPKTEKKKKKRKKKGKRKGKDEGKDEGKDKGKDEGKDAQEPLSRVTLRSAVRFACSATPSVPPKIPVSSGGIPAETMSDQSSSPNSAKISPPTATSPVLSSHASLPTEMPSVSAEVTQPAEESLSTSSRTPSSIGFLSLPEESGESLTSSTSSSSDSEQEEPAAGPPPAKVMKTSESSRSDQIQLVDTAESLPSTSRGPSMTFREPVLSTESDQSSSTYSTPSQASSAIPYSLLGSRNPTPSSEASDVALLGKIATLGEQSSPMNQPSLGLPGKISCQLAAILRGRHSEQAEPNQPDDVFADPSDVRSRHGESSTSSTLPVGGSPGEQQEREANAFLIGAMMNFLTQEGLDIPVDAAIANFRHYFESEHLAALWDNWKRHIAEKYKAKKK